MKSLFGAALIVALVSSTPVISGGKTFNVTNAGSYKNQIKFVSEMPLEKINGLSEGVKGSFTMDVQKPEDTKGSIIVDVKSMKTGNGMRDEHMYAEDWLNAETYGTITYNIKSLKDVKVESNAGGKVQLTATAIGDFTLHGTTKPLNATVTITYLTESTDTKKIAAGDLILVKTNFTVPMLDYGVKGKAGIVGKKVNDKIEINATLFAVSK